MVKSRDNLRPTTLDDYIGQDRTKRLVDIAMEAARQRNEPLDHVLLNGPPGLGKTTLANIIATEMKWKLKTVVSTNLGSPRAVVELVQQLPRNTILFIDEIHRLRTPAQETLYPLLEDGKLFSWIGPVELKINPVTIIGATTNVGKLQRPFIDRFPLQFQLEYYDPVDLVQVLKTSAVKLGISRITDGALEAIAARSRGTPRLANNYLRRLRDFIQVMGRPGTEELVISTLEAEFGIDNLGLTRLDRRYLEVLADAQGGMGVEAIAVTLGEDEDTITDFIEPYLITRGLIERRRNGRWITEEGMKYAEE